MVKFDVKANDTTYHYNLPSSVKEIPTEYFTGITKHIEVAPYHSLLAIVFRDKMSNILFAGKSKKASIGVSPIFVKCGECDSEFVKKVTPGSVVGIMSTQLQLGLHVSVANNDLSIDSFMQKATQDKDIMAHPMQYNDEVCFVEFKVVNNSDITFVYSKDSEYKPTFVTKDKVK